MVVELTIANANQSVRDGIENYSQVGCEVITNGYKG